MLCRALLCFALLCCALLCFALLDASRRVATRRGRCRVQASSNQSFCTLQEILAPNSSNTARGYRGGISLCWYLALRELPLLSTDLQSLIETMRSDAQPEERLDASAVEQILFDFLHNTSDSYAKRRWLRRAMKLTQTCADSLVEERLQIAVAQCFAVLQSLLNNTGGETLVCLSSRYIACVALFLYLQHSNSRSSDSMSLWHPVKIPTVLQTCRPIGCENMTSKTCIYIYIHIEKQNTLRYWTSMLHHLYKARGSLLGHNWVAYTQIIKVLGVDITTL